MKRCRFTTHVGSLLLCVCVVMATSAIAAVTPYSKYLQNLSLIADPDGNYYHDNPKMAVSNQFVHLLWVGTTKDWSNRVIFYVRSIDGGKTFEKPIQLVEHAEDLDKSFNGFLADGKYLHFFYAIGWPKKLYYIRSTDNGATFETAVIISSGYYEYTIYAAAADGKVALGYSVNGNDSPHPRGLYCAHSSDAGATFLTTTMSYNDDNTNPGIYRNTFVDAVRSGDKVYFLTQITDENWFSTASRFFLFASWDNGATFKTPVMVTVPASNEKTYSVKVQDQNYSPNLFADGDTVNIVWVNNDNPGGFDGWWAPTLRTRRSTDGGLTLTNPVTLHTYPEGYHSGANPGLETITGKGSNLYITTVISGDNQGTKVWKSADAGASWSQEKQVFDGGWWPHIGISPSNASKIHLTNGWYMESPDAGSNYTGGVNPHLNFYGWNYPDMSISSDGVVHYCGISGVNFYDGQLYYRRLAPEPQPEKVDQAVVLAKTGSTRQDNLQVPSFSNINFSTQMTLEFLALRSDAYAWDYFENMVSKKRISKESSYEMGMWNSFHIYGRLVTEKTDANYGAWMDSGVTLTKNVWTHIAMTYDASLSANNWKIFVNGQLANQMDVKGAILVETMGAPLVIGNDNTQGSTGSMNIDEVRLWNRPLSASEIAANMFKSLTGTENGLTAYYNFNNSFKELTGKGYDAVPMFWESFVPTNLPAVLSVSPGSRDVANGNGTTTFGVSNTGAASMPWTAAVTSGNTWLTITSGASGTNSGTITCAFTANTGTTSRTGTIQVTASGATGSPKDVTVTQAAAPASVSISGSVKTGSGTAISGVTISFSNSGGTATTDAIGNYSKSVPYGYSGTATPAKSGFTFTPSSKTFTNVTTHQSNQNFTGTAQSGSRQQFLGVWSDGVWVWDKTTNKWTVIASTSNASMIAAGKVDSDAIDDLIGVWPSGFYVKQSNNGQWIKLSTALPTWIAAGDLNNDGRDDVIGTWTGDGAYYRDSATGKWIKLSSPARQLATGNIGGIRDDLAAVYNDGLWVRYSADGSWKKIDAGIPLWITAGDMTGDKRADIIGSYSTGTWYRNSANGAWIKLTTPASQLAAGDLDGDGRDDLVGIWSNSVYVRYGASGQWQQISTSKPRWIATGKMMEAIQTAGSLEDPAESGEEILDMSDEGPGGWLHPVVSSEADGPMISE